MIPPAAKPKFPQPESKSMDVRQAARFKLKESESTL